MIWLLHDFDLLSVLARAANLAFEALLLGGLAYLFFAVRPTIAAYGSEWPPEAACRRGIRKVAVALAISEAVALAISIAELTGESAPFWPLLKTTFFLAGSAAIVLSLAIWFFASLKGGQRVAGMLCVLITACSVAASHAAARLEHRGFLLVLTALHHLGMALWIGAMPFLLLSLRSADDIGSARTMAQRYSVMALAGAGTLVAAGVGLAVVYIGSPSGLYSTTYGILLLAKIYLLLLMMVLGTGNWLVVRRLNIDPEPLLAHIRRFAEVEIGLGFTVVLAAASLTAQPPAIDVSVASRPTTAEIYARMHPEMPRLHTPQAKDLTPATPINVAIVQSQFQPISPSDAKDRAWSEYNHHWAGIIVLLAGLLAWTSRLPHMGWARFWPISFAGLAVFIVLRADPETWPLGPRPFWKSFSAADVLEHRAAALLILLFAVFECAVQANKLRARWAGMIFPAMCVIGAAILLTHDHAGQDVKEELFAAMNHTPIALMGATAGWGRWLELRLPESRVQRVASRLWPAFLVAAGLLLLNYREM